jgi:hypothetical protein
MKPVKPPWPGKNFLCDEKGPTVHYRTFGVPETNTVICRCGGMDIQGMSFIMADIYISLAMKTMPGVIGIVIAIKNIREISKNEVGKND